MKKRVRVLGVAVLTMALLAGCGNTTEGTKEVQTTESKKDLNETNVTQVSSNDSEIKVLRSYEYLEPSEYYFGDNGCSYYDIHYYLRIIDENTAQLNVVNPYAEDYVASSTYTGTYEVKNNYIKFRYDRENTNYVFKLENDKIVNLISFTGQIYEPNLEGTYTAYSEDYGNLSLVISPFNTIEMTTENSDDFSGYIFDFNGTCDLMAHTPEVEGEYSEYIDWILEFDGDTFSHIPYSEYAEDPYGEYNMSHGGEYVIYGDLGEITLIVDDKSDATTVIEYNGKTINFSGSVYTNSDDEYPTSAYLYSEDYSLNLYINYMEGEGILNYSGSITVPLGAG